MLTVGFAGFCSQGTVRGGGILRGDLGDGVE